MLHQLDASTVRADPPVIVGAALGAANPAEPVPLTELRHTFGIEPRVAVLAVDDAVLAAEYNGWQGADKAVLRALSRNGRAASMYWNVEALTRLSFAREGEVAAAFEPGIEQYPPLESVLADLDFADYRDKIGKGLAAVESFTGRGFRPEDLVSLEEAGMAYEITAG